jgi:hypothetical protein
MALEKDSERTIECVKAYTEELREKMLRELLEWSSCDGLVKPRIVGRKILEMVGAVDSIDGITIRHAFDWPGYAFRIFDEANREKELRVEFSRAGFELPKDLSVYAHLRITVEVINDG